MNLSPSDSFVPSVTVVIPAFNEERFIARCLRALQAVEYPADKIAIRVVDNDSEDATARIAAELGASVVRAERRTVAYSRNIGARDARSELIAFLDADCLPGPRWLAQAARDFASARVVAAGSYPTVLPEESNALQKTWAALCGGNTKEVREVDWLPTANLVVRTEVFRRIGGFNESLATCEDVDIGYRLRAHGSVIFDPAITVYHLREPKTFREFMCKEMWHAKNNISGLWSHGLRWSEIPSLASPLAFGLGFVAGVTGLLVGSPYLMLGGFALSVAIPTVYAARGLRRSKNLPLVFSLYSVYFTARSLASARELWHLLTHRRSI